jgi:hypothetical protein
MAGITATLSLLGATFPNGYIDLPFCRTDLTIREPGYEKGKCIVSHRYYLSKAAYDADPNSFITVNSDPIPDIELPYVPSSDPIQSALVVLQGWFPGCEVFT